MESKRRMEQYKRDELIERIVNNARVYQGGGNELTGSGSPLQDSVRAALEDSLIRLFPKFSIADHKSWGTVATRARDGSNDPLSVLSYAGNIEDHPTCKEILGFVDILGKKGIDIRKHFMGAGYGWSQDAVDGALLCLVRAGFVRATRNGEPINIKLLQTQQLGQAEFFREGVTVSAAQKIAIRGFLTNLGLSTKSGEEADAVSRALQRLAELARAAGGEAPHPERPSIDPIQRLQTLSGNEQLVAVYQQRDELLDYFKNWTKTGEVIKRACVKWYNKSTNTYRLPVPLRPMKRPQSQHESSYEPQTLSQRPDRCSVEYP
jgi:hypothetical protein